MRANRSRWRWEIVGAFALVALVVVLLAARVFDEPLRRRIETQMNASLKGYHAYIKTLRFHPLGFSVDLVDWVLVQDANPQPPVAYIPKLHASLQWMELIRGHVVSDFRFDRPQFYLDLRHVKQEAEDKTSIKEKGWQDAASAIYPFKINMLRIVDGDVTYIEQGPMKPVHISDLTFRASNIRNVHSRKGTYPSEIHLTGALADTARLRVDGHADFLAEPFAAVKADFDLGGLRLDYLEPIVRHYDVTVRSGALSTTGEVEYGPAVQRLDLSDVTLVGADIDYAKRHTAEPPPTRKVAEVAAKVTQQPATVVKAERIRIKRGKFGYADETTDPPYRLFVSDCDAIIRHFTNVRTDDSAARRIAELRGKFMGSGDTRIHATFQPRRDRSDFEMKLSIDDADMPAMNDLWRAFGKFDIERGEFSLYAEITVRNGMVDGYVKPIFRDLALLKPGEEMDTSIGHKVYEAVVAGVGKILENRPRKQVATKTSLSGPLENPRSSILEVVGRLVQNAFFKAILPGLEPERGAPR